MGKNKWTNFAENARNYALYIKEKDLFISHALQNPQIDRSKPLNGIPKNYAGIHTIKRNFESIIVSGAKMVNTMAPIADDLLVFNPPELLLEKVILVMV